MKLSECKGKSFLLNGRIITYQSLLKMIYEGNQFGPISIADIDSTYANELANVKEQMGVGANETEKSLNLLKTEIVEIDITKDDIKPVNANKTMFAVAKKDPSTIFLSECVNDDYIFMCNGAQVEMSDILGMIYNKKEEDELPVVQAIQMDTMYDHDMALAMQALYMNNPTDNSNYELGMLKTKTVILDIKPEKIEKVEGYDDMYVLKHTKSKKVPKTTVVTDETTQAEPEIIPTFPIAPEETSTTQVTNIQPPVTENTEKISVPTPNTQTETPGVSGQGTNDSALYGPWANYGMQQTTPDRTPAQQVPSSDTQGNSQESMPTGSTVEYWRQAAINPNLSPEPDAEPPKKKSKVAGKLIRFFKNLLGWGINLVIIGTIVYVLGNYVLFNAEIPSESMEPTVSAGDKIIGNRLTYQLERPERGDIVIFHNPDNYEEYYIKRIIGLPGETVVISEGKIYINGSETALNEPYLAEAWTVANDGYAFEIPDGEYLMLGDNRNASYDARYWENTYVPQEYFVAEAIIRYFPLNELSVLNENQDTFYKVEETEK